jgi:hypothetical protein
MRGTWLPRTGLLCLLAGILFLLLSCVGLATGEWVWAPFVLGVALLIVAQILVALGDILSELRAMHQRVARLEEQNSGDPNKTNGE